MTHVKKRRFGQHFLEPPWVARLVDAIDPRPDETFLEIGPGRGALTLALADRGVRLLAVEIDTGLARELTARVPSNVTIITADFLTLNLDHLSDLAMPTRAVGNLPYSVAAPILLRVLRLSDHGARLRDATLMLQREVADRVTAGPGSAGWGPLAVAVRLHGEAQRLMTLPPGAFRPIPRVRSSLVRVRFGPTPVRIGHPALFDSLVRVLFTQRRKTALNALRPFAVRVSRLPVTQVFARAGVDPGQRPGHLTLMELAELSEVLASTSL